MAFDPTVSVGSLVQVVTLIGAIIVFVFGLQRRIDGLATQIDGLRTEISKLSNVVATQAAQNARLDMHEKVIDDMRRGKGYILEHWRGPARGDAA